MKTSLFMLPVALLFGLLPLNATADSSLRSGEEILRRSAQGIRFEQACAPGRKITIGAVGDVLLNGPLKTQVFTDPIRFAGLWNGVKDLLRRPDITYANLEGPTAYGVNKEEKDVPDPGFIYDDNVYSGLPDVNYHPSLIRYLQSAGIDVVSTGNNHALDRGPLGLERTIEALQRAGMPFSGTRTRSDRDPERHVITQAKGVRIAWISCSYQNRRNPDPQHLVLGCFKDSKLIQQLIRRIVRTRSADAVFVVPHWGEMFVHIPGKKEIRQAHRFLEAGALAVLAAHPHYIQPWERVITRDGRETFVIYSLGNFVTGQRDFARRVTILLNLGLTKTRSGKVILNGVRYTPMVMTPLPSDEEGMSTLQAIDRHPLRDEPGPILEAKELLLSILGSRNLAPSNKPLVTNPECSD